MQFVQKVIMYSTESTDHPPAADQVSSPWIKQFSRYLADKFKMPKFSKGHNTGKIWWNVLKI